MRLVLEMAMIGLGVFLGLMGDQWRENADHRALANATLHRFRTEIAANRAALASQRGYHDSLRTQLETFLTSNGPRTLSTFRVHLHGIGQVAFEHSAWDLALATQSLAYVDEDLAFKVSRVYTMQRGYTDQQASIVQSTIYGRSWTGDFEGYWRSVAFYLGDLSVLDPALLAAYDDVLPRIDRAMDTSR